MTNNRSAHRNHIDTALLQLSFAFKLQNYLDEHPIDRDKFDVALTIEDSNSRICLVHDEFQTYDDLQLAATNNVSIVFGAVAITLWEAISEYAGLKSKLLDPQASKRENLASLSYMIRCCFAHGTAQPIWSIFNPKYKTIYRVGNKTIDLSVIVDGQPFEYSSISGHETLVLLAHEARANGLLDSASSFL